jgi:poly(3-hydroxyalkanoate) depolymerase
LPDVEGFAIRHVTIGSQALRVGIKRGHRPTPLLVFNGIGANLELLEGVAKALPDTEVVAFDVPGVGGSPLPRRPYRLRTLARLADEMLKALGYQDAVDVLGVSWGGAVAQQFARSHGLRCRRLVLADTAAGSVMLPGRLSALLALATPRRYTDSAYMLRAASKIYGGQIAAQPELMTPFARHMRPPSMRGYLLQQLALAGWTSLHWLSRIRQPTLILAGRHDPLVHLANAKVMHRLIPHSRLEIIDDGHLFLLTSGDAVAGSILRFLTAADRVNGSESAPAPGRSASACAD